MSADSQPVVTPSREFATIDGAEVLQLPAERSESGFEESEPDSTAERVYAVDALAKKLKVKLPKQRPQPVDFLKFQSWWIEKNTKRVVEVAFELATERFRITLDKEVYFLKSDMNYTHLTESNLAAVMKDTKVLECHLHEKYSDNQHALSLNLAHLECWDLHVGAKINLFGRPSTLMACDLKTGIWLEYHAKGLRAIKESIEEVLRKFELVQLKSSLRDTGGVNKIKREWEQGATLPSQFRPRAPFLPATTDRGARGSPSNVLGGADLRTMLRQTHTLRERLVSYRPKMAEEYLALISEFAPHTTLPADES